MGSLSFGRFVNFWFVLLVTAAIAAPAQTFTSLVSFDGSDGMRPSFELLAQGVDGNFYGTTLLGGADSFGTVFKVSRSGELTTIYNFCSQPGCADGIAPYAGLVLGADGDFYGTTEQGGTGQAGTIFKVAPDGTLSTLHTFDFVDGGYPQAQLIQGTDGNFYGTTSIGTESGTVFKTTPTGTFTTLHTFSGSPSDGAAPFGGLIQAANGSFYGTTSAGGANGYGTVFQLTPSGGLTVLHSFNYRDGAYPYGQLVQARNGFFYGTTSAGGVRNDGTVFKIDTAGTLTTLHSFCAKPYCPDGVVPFAGLTPATDGSFYGTASGGGNSGNGTLFKITPGGVETTIYSFCPQGIPCTDGSAPYGGLMQATNGVFYGTTFVGGANGVGTVFSLSAGLGPFVETVPTSGKIGAKVTILGNGLTGATSVAFNGTSAKFKVVSDTDIVALVPDGATSGFLEVVTPGATLKSNVAFRVRP